MHTCGHSGTVTAWVQQINAMQYSAIYCTHYMALTADEVPAHIIKRVIHTPTGNGGPVLQYTLQTHLTS